MSKIIKKARSAKQGLESFNIEKFVNSKDGESDSGKFNYILFKSSDLSVQDHNESILNTHSEDEAPRKLVVKHVPKTAVYSIYNPGDGKPEEVTRIFGEFDRDGSNKKRYVIGYELEDLTKHSDNIGSLHEETRNVDEVDNTPDLQPLVSITPTDIQILNDKIAELENENNTLKKTNLDLQNSLKGDIDKAFSDGYSKALEEYKEKENIKYMAQREDYLSKVEASLNDLRQEVNKINEVYEKFSAELPEIVVSYVEDIIGKERLLNDKFIVGVIGSSLAKLKELSDIILSVCPDDFKIVSESYPELKVISDNSISHGCIKIKTKIGFINISVNELMEELKRKIDEEFGADKKD